MCSQDGSEVVLIHIVEVGSIFFLITLKYIQVSLGTNVLAGSRASLVQVRRFQFPAALRVPGLGLEAVGSESAGGR